MTEIQLSIEGEGAVEATQEIMDIPGISGHWDIDKPDALDKESVLATIASIVAITGGVVAIAEQIREWHEKWKEGKQKKRIRKVTLRIPEHRQIVLNNATVEDIGQALQLLVKNNSNKKTG